MKEKLRDCEIVMVAYFSCLEEVAIQHHCAAVTMTDRNWFQSSGRSEEKNLG